MGKLRSFSDVSGATELVIDLLETRDPTEGEGLIVRVADRYRSLLRKQLTAHKLSQSWVTAARVRIDFSPTDSALKRYAYFGTGQPFGCTVEVVDDNSRLYFANAYGRVTPHDPEKESRAIRHDEF